MFGSGFVMLQGMFGVLVKYCSRECLEFWSSRERFIFWLSLRLLDVYVLGWKVQVKLEV